ncbi:hypothetical protein E2K93_03305 [Thalassotalea sp. HSM 43]|uniref:hypothetical protein n=1 Tax=Thalassotalea sp. HSM 43 TaxID=2552945 RepID=UPI0010801568|nr:hypothetical protein [Thalassotalea sp. HSM 43]QBY03460.1 hypothetical protein E2K93_03305 [Thalassotalea sp. HSM 43]
MKIMKRIISTAVAATLVLTPQAMAMDYQNLNKQLNIMSDILKSSVNENSGKGSRSKVSKIEGHYLAGQGVLFTVNLNHSSFYGMPLALPVVPVAPVAPRPPKAPKGMDGEALFGEEFEVVIEEAMEEAVIALEAAQESIRYDVEQQRQLREQERDLAYQLRDIAREERDLSYQRSHLDKDEQKSIEQDLKQLEARKKEINKAKQKLAAESKKYQQKVAQLKQQRIEEQKAFMQYIEQQVSNVLCNYGGGLREVPAQQFVSVIIKGGGDKTNQGYKDKVLVFNKADVKNCVLEKFDAPALLSKANGYQF